MSLYIFYLISTIGYSIFTYTSIVPLSLSFYTKHTLLYILAVCQSFPSLKFDSPAKLWFNIQQYTCGLFI